MTKTQNNLLNILIPIFRDNQNRIPLTYEELKTKANFKSFESSFNALHSQGYIVRYDTNDFRNRFIFKQKL